MARLSWLGQRPRGDTPRDLARQLQQDAVPAAVNAYLRAAAPEEGADQAGDIMGDFDFAAAPLDIGDA